MAFRRLDQYHTDPCHSEHFVEGHGGSRKVMVAFLAENKVERTIAGREEFRVFRLVGLDETAFLRLNQSRDRDVGGHSANAGTLQEVCVRAGSAIPDCQPMSFGRVPDQRSHQVEHAAMQPSVDAIWSRVARRQPKFLSGMLLVTPL